MACKKARNKLQWDYDADDGYGRRVWRAESPNGDGNYVVWVDHTGLLHWSLMTPGSTSGVGPHTRFRTEEAAARDAEAHANYTGRWAKDTHNEHHP